MQPNARVREREYDVARMLSRASNTLLQAACRYRSGDLADACEELQTVAALVKTAEKFIRLEQTGDAA
jgi:hypothetical protein